MTRAERLALIAVHFQHLGLRGRLLEVALTTVRDRRRIVAELDRLRLALGLPGP